MFGNRFVQIHCVGFIGQASADHAKSGMQDQVLFITPSKNSNSLLSISFAWGTK